jgi:hypothetical protein
MQWQKIAIAVLTQPFQYCESIHDVGQGESLVVGNYVACVDHTPSVLDVPLHTGDAIMKSNHPANSYMFIPRFPIASEPIVTMVAVNENKIDGAIGVGASGLFSGPSNPSYAAITNFRNGTLCDHLLYAKAEPSGRIRIYTQQFSIWIHRGTQNACGHAVPDADLNQFVFGPGVVS